MSRTERLSIMAQNAMKDPNYSPYCMRCPGLVRMRRVEPMLWNCPCGAIHDERDNFTHDELQAMPFTPSHPSLGKMLRSVQLPRR